MSRREAEGRIELSGTKPADISPGCINGGFSARDRSLLLFELCAPSFNSSLHSKRSTADAREAAGSLCCGLRSLAQCPGLVVACRAVRHLEPVHHVILADELLPHLLLVRVRLPCQVEHLLARPDEL